MKTTSASVPSVNLFQVVSVKIMRFVKWAMVP